MTPKEKAAQLVVDNQLKVKSLDYNEAVQCALITVDELIAIAQWGGEIDNEIDENSKEFFIKVKQELESYE